MNLLDVYTLLDKNEITEEEAAKSLNMTTKLLRFRMTRWGHRLPLLLSILDKIREDKISRSEAAAALQVGLREINLLMKSWNVVRPVKEYVLNKEKANIKWEIRKRYSLDYISGHMTLDDAAEAANVSPRQMRRWISEMLKKHFDMPWGDLKELDSQSRLRHAQEIEIAENLELEKQQTLNAISRGKKDIEAEALDRLLSRKEKKSTGKKINDRQ